MISLRFVIYRQRKKLPTIRLQFECFAPRTTNQKARKKERKKERKNETDTAFSFLVVYAIFYVFSIRVQLLGIPTVFMGENISSIFIGLGFASRNYTRMFTFAEKKKRKNEKEKDL